MTIKKNLRNYFEDYDLIEAKADRLEDLRDLADDTVPREVVTIVLESILEDKGHFRKRFDTKPTKTALECACEDYHNAFLSVATEAWNFEDFWSTLKTTEKINGELKDNLSIYRNKKDWYEQSHLVLNSVGIFNYLTDHKGKVQNIEAASRKSAAVLEDLVSLSKSTMDKAEGMYKLFDDSKLHTDAAVKTLLDKLTKYTVVDERAVSKLMGAYTLGGRIINVKRKTQKPAEDTFSISLDKTTIMPVTNELTPEQKALLKKSGFATAAMGLLAFAFGAGTVVLSGALSVGIIIGKGAARVAGHLKSTFTETHEVSYEEIGKALTVITEAVDKATKMKRDVQESVAYCERIRKTFKEVEADATLSKEGRSQLRTIFNLLNNAERFSLELAEVSIALALVLAKGSNGIARKL